MLKQPRLKLATPQEVMTSAGDGDGDGGIGRDGQVCYLTAVSLPLKGPRPLACLGTILRAARITV